jgi:acyl transferase domain-containing protein
LPGIAESSSASMSVAKLALSIKHLRAETQGIGLLESEPLAIVGMACRFPGGADSPQEFWQNLIEGREAIREMPESRWKPDPMLSSVMRKGGYLEEVDAFDADFFGITPREAAYIDPQHRLMLEMTWDALHDAGIPPEALSGTPAGVWAALSSTDYFRMQLRDVSQLASYVGMGAAHCMASGQISFLLNLHGPNTVVDTACSSSLVAVHMACQSLRNRECNLAIVTAANLKLLPDEVIVYAKLGMLASDGHTKSFDERADGLVPGEGSGAVIVKRFADALADGNRIRAVIRGSAINHNGRTAVLSAPSGVAQRQVIQNALRNARVSAEDITYIETHGTGTSLGDPIEVEALREVYDKKNGESCVLGAVKTNLGHLEAAAGMAGLIKVILALEHSELPANLNWNQLNSQIDLDGSRFRLPQEKLAWSRGAHSRFAGISSFGISGTNAHVVIEEAPPQRALKTTEREVNILVISAKCDESLKASAERFAAYLRTSGISTSAVCASAAIHRSHLSHRLAVVGGSSKDIAEKLEAFAAGRLERSTYVGTSNTSDPPRLVFTYSDQSPISSRAAFDRISRQPMVREVVDAIDAIFAPLAGCSLIHVLQSQDSEQWLKRDEVARGLSFAVQTALTAVLASHGIMPTVATGTGVGELAAACANEVTTLEDATRNACRGGVPTLDCSAMIKSLVTQGYRIFIEIGSSPSLSKLVDACAESRKVTAHSYVVLREDRSSDESIAELSAALYAQGVRINWHSLYPGAVPVISLPAYPWQRKKLWFEQASPDSLSPSLIAQLQASDAASGHRLIADHVETCVRTVTRVDPSRTIRHDQPLQLIGLDSLMAMMLRNMLQVSTGLQLPSSFAFQNPTIESMSGYIETMLWGKENPTAIDVPDSIREEIRL